MIVSPTAGRRPPTPRPISPWLMSCEPEVPENSFDANGLAVDVCLEGIAGERDAGPVSLLACLRPLRRCRHSLDQVGHRLALPVVHAGRREHAAPVEQLHVDAFLLEGRSIDPGLALVGGDC